MKSVVQSEFIGLFCEYIRQKLCCVTVLDLTCIDVLIHRIYLKYNLFLILHQC